MKLEEYYKYYLTLHQNHWNRRLHMLGQLVTLIYIILAITQGLYLILLLSPFIVYPFAWTGHFVFEKNEPAAFSNPFYAKVCDWIMIKDIMMGKIPF